MYNIRDIIYYTRTMYLVIEINMNVFFLILVIHVFCLNDCIII